MWFDSASSRGALSMGSPALVDPNFTERAIAEIAAGRASADLFAGVDRWTRHWDEVADFPDTRLRFEYVALAHERYSSSSVGWPITLWSRTVIESFDDPTTRTGLRVLKTSTTLPPAPDLSYGSDVIDGAVRSRSRWSWWAGSIVLTPPVEETGGRIVNTAWRLSSIGSLLGLIALAWIVSGLIGYAIDIRRYRRRKPGIGRRVRGIVVFIAVTALTIGTVMTTRSSESVLQHYGAEKHAPAVPIPLVLLRDFKAHRPAPDRDQWFASAITPANADPAALSAQMYLAVGVTTDWQRDWTGMWGKHFNLISRDHEVFTYKGDGDGETLELPRAWWKWENSRLTFGWSDGSTQRSKTAIDLTTLGTIFALALLLFAACVSLRALWDWAERRSRRRARRCVACGHPVTPGASDVHVPG